MFGENSVSSIYRRTVLDKINQYTHFIMSILKYQKVVIYTFVCYACVECHIKKKKKSSSIIKSLNLGLLYHIKMPVEATILYGRFFSFSSL